MLLSIRLESQSLGMQVVQAPGNAQGAQAITPVMKDFARNAWHGVAAETVTSRRLEAIEGADQAHAPLLDEVVTLAIASVELTLRTEVGETQMLENSIVAFKNGPRKCSASFATAMKGGLVVAGFRRRLGDHGIEALNCLQTLQIPCYAASPLRVKCFPPKSEVSQFQFVLMRLTTGVVAFKKLKMIQILDEDVEVTICRISLTLMTGI